MMIRSEQQRRRDTRIGAPVRLKRRIGNHHSGKTGHVFELYSSDRLKIEFPDFKYLVVPLSDIEDLRPNPKAWPNQTVRFRTLDGIELEGEVLRIIRDVDYGGPIDGVWEISGLVVDVNGNRIVISEDWIVPRL